MGLMAVGCLSCVRNPSAAPDWTMGFRAGDQLAWLERSADQDAWINRPPGSPQRERGLWWMQAEVNLPEADPGNPWTVEIQTLGSYQVYWDGQLIARNGRFGKGPQDELPGTHLFRFTLPTDNASPGHHLMALRVSTWQSGIPQNYFKLNICSLDDLILERQLATGFYALVFGLLLLAGLTTLAMRPSNDQGALRFGFLCLAVSALLAVEYGKFIVQYRYDLHVWRLIAITALTLWVTSLLPLFILARFKLRHKAYRLLAVTPLLVFPLIWHDPDQHCFAMFQYGLAYSLFLCIRAAAHRYPGWLAVAVFIAFTLILSMVTGNRFADRWFFPLFLLLVVILAARVILEMRQQRSALRAAQLTSARLRLELLRKSIQPHFLKNSLAAAIGWLEENPKKGTGLLESLANELEGFFKLGDRELIDLNEELQLCRQHVTTMSMLKDRPIELRIHGQLHPIKVPPGLLLTCVENAMTHGLYDRQGGSVTIEVGITRTGYVLGVSNPARGDGETAEHTGTSYVRALLARHYASAWDYRARCRDGTWETRIEINDHSDQGIT